MLTRVIISWHRFFCCFFFCSCCWSSSLVRSLIHWWRWWAHSFYSSRNLWCKTTCEIHQSDAIISSQRRRPHCKLSCTKLLKMLNDTTTAFSARVDWTAPSCRYYIESISFSFIFYRSSRHLRCICCCECVTNSLWFFVFFILFSFSGA